jgi:hypothetical protein
VEVRVREPEDDELYGPDGHVVSYPHRFGRPWRHSRDLPKTGIRSVARPDRRHLPREE